MAGKMVPFPYKRNRKDIDIEYDFLIVCRYLNIKKNQTIILHLKENSQIVKTLKFCTEYWKI